MLRLVWSSTCDTLLFLLQVHRNTMTELESRRVISLLLVQDIFAECLSSCIQCRGKSIWTMFGHLKSHGHKDPNNIWNFLTIWIAVWTEICANGRATNLPVISYLSMNVVEHQSSESFEPVQSLRWRCYSPLNPESVNTCTSVSKDFLLAGPIEIFCMPGFGLPILPLWNFIELCGDVCGVLKSDLHSLDDRLRLTNLMIHLLPSRKQKRPRHNLSWAYSKLPQSMDLQVSQCRNCVICGIFVAIFLCHCFWRRMWSHGFSPSCITGVFFVSTVYCHRLWSIVSFEQKSPRSAFNLAETCSLGIPTDRFDMFLSKQDARPLRGCKSAFDGSPHKTSVSIAFRPLAKTNPWLTHQQLISQVCFAKEKF